MPDENSGGEWRPRPGDLAAALGFLTRFPVAGSFGRFSPDSAWAWPFIGALLGAAAAAVVEISLFLGMSGFLASAMALAFLVAATGALHEDGLADTADGLWGGSSKDSRLKIMRDSRIGAFGVVAIGLFFLGRWSGIAELAESNRAIAALISACAVSRAAMAAAMHLVPPARTDGLSASVGRPGRGSIICGIAAAAAVSAACVGWVSIPLIVVAGAAVAPVCWLALKRIGGQTGDVLGAAQQCAEIAALVFLAAAL